MSTGHYEYQSEFAKKYIQQGLEQGLERGLEQGVLRARVEALQTVLEARGLPLTAAQRREIESTRDAELLDEWIRAAATAESVEAIFGATLR